MRYSRATPLVLTSVLICIAGIVASCGEDTPLLATPPGVPVEPPPVEPPPPDPPPSPEIPAFPGAEGWGAEALSASRRLPLAVHAVRNTNSTGPGSLQEALSRTADDHYDVIIFQTGGRIVAPELGFQLNRSHVYIAGQTAPGDGVLIDGDGTSFWLRGSGANVSDVVIRYLRFRGLEGRVDNHLVVAKGERLVLDHLSFSWSNNFLLAILRYGGMPWSAPISRVSVQNSLLAEAGLQPTAAHIATNDEMRDDAFIDLTDISIHRNLFAHNSHRNPNSGADNILLANNVLYNWNQGALQLTMRGMADFVNNYGRAGPMTHPAFLHLVNPRCEPSGVVEAFSMYVVGNVGPASMDPDGDNWVDPTRQVACYYRSGDFEGQPAPEGWRRDEPQSWAEIPFPVKVTTAEEALVAVVRDVGANARLTCGGTWVSASDAVDERILSELATGGGPSVPPTVDVHAGAVPVYNPGSPCLDSDGDGIPDEWESQYFGCPTCADPAAVTEGGYLVIEHFLNGTTPH